MRRAIFWSRGVFVAVYLGLALVLVQVAEPHRVTVFEFWHDETVSVDMKR